MYKCCSYGYCSHGCYSSCCCSRGFFSLCCFSYGNFSNGCSSRGCYSRGFYSRDCCSQLLLLLWLLLPLMLLPRLQFSLTLLSWLMLPAVCTCCSSGCSSCVCVMWLLPGLLAECCCSLGSVPVAAAPMALCSCDFCSCVCFFRSWFFLIAHFDVFGLFCV
jgi:hypothetical protein